MKKNTIGILLLILPIFLILFSFIYQKNLINNAKELKVSISGYDPRDLIRGHYLSLQVNWLEHLEEKDLTPDDMLCLFGGDDSVLKIEKYNQQENCDYVVKNSKLPKGRVKFYVADKDALTLEKSLLNQRLDKKINTAEALIVFPKGSFIIKNILFDGVNWKEWLLP